MRAFSYTISSEFESKWRTLTCLQSERMPLNILPALYLIILIIAKRKYFESSLLVESEHRPEGICNKEERRFVVQKKRRSTASGRECDVGKNGFGKGISIEVCDN